MLDQSSDRFVVTDELQFLEEVRREVLVVVAWRVDLGERIEQNLVWVGFDAVHLEKAVVVGADWDAEGLGGLLSVGEQKISVTGQPDWAFVSCWFWWEDTFYDPVMDQSLRLRIENYLDHPQVQRPSLRNENEELFVIHLRQVTPFIAKPSSLILVNFLL